MTKKLEDLENRLEATEAEKAITSETFYLYGLRKS